jgi:HAD superfamily hydrolase (TIGR01509 family)
MRHKAAIFDMDGLLLDTERICMECFYAAGGHLGCQINPEVYLRCIGTTETSTRSILIEGHDPGFPYEEIRELWRKLYLAEIEGKPVPVKSGAVELLEKMVASCIPVGLATSTAFERALARLENSGLLSYFDCMITGDQVAMGKPHPEIYLRAAMELGVKPSECIAFEDSENGVRAAISAGMTVIQVPDLVRPAGPAAPGHTILSSLNDFTWPVGPTQE